MPNNLYKSLPGMTADLYAQTMQPIAQAHFDLNANHMAKTAPSGGPQTASPVTPMGGGQKVNGFSTVNYSHGLASSNPLGVAINGPRGV
jgi:hypothetical protein